MHSVWDGRWPQRLIGGLSTVFYAVLAAWGVTVAAGHPAPPLFWAAVAMWIGDSAGVLLHWRLHGDGKPPA